MKSKILTMLLSLMIAFVLWAYVVSVEAPESETTYENISVVLDGKTVLENRGLMLVGQKNFTVDLTLSGYRTDLKKLNNTNITVLADLSQITAAGTHELDYTISYPGELQNGNIRVVNQKPMRITVTVAELETKDIPVVTILKGNLPANYLMGNVVLDHNMITVSGPKDVIDKIEEAWVEIDKTDRKENFTDRYTYSLRDGYGQPVEELEEVTANVSGIVITVEILRTKLVPVKLHVIAGGGLTENMITIKYSVDAIIVSGSEKNLESITEISLRDKLDLSTLTKTETLEDLPIYLPPGITSANDVTTVTVTITVPEMETRSFRVTNFEPLHVPEGMKVTFGFDQLEVKLRGPKELLAQVKPEDIWIVVDFANAQIGESTYSAVIRVDGVEGVGAVEVYVVPATLTEQETPEE